MLVLTLSDAHIPDRAVDLPLKFKKLLAISNKISEVVLLGNCTKSYEFLKFINDISPNVTLVRGEFDNAQLPTTRKNRSKEVIPMDTVIKQGDFKIGCCSGYTVVPKNDPLSLLALARQLDVDILLWGGTHNVEAYTLEGKFFVNPGSCTGAFNSDWPILGEEESLSRKGGPAQQQQYDRSPDQRQKEGREREQNQGQEQDQERQEEDQKEDQNQEQDQSQEQEAVREEDASGYSKDSERAENDKAEATSSESTKSASEHKVEDAPTPSQANDQEEFDIPELDIEGSNVPSFCLLDIQGATCTLYIYIYVDGEVKVDKVVYKKND